MTLSLNTSNIHQLVGSPIEELRELYPLPPQLQGIRDDFDLNNEHPDFRFEERHSAANITETYVLDEACAGKLWDIGMKISDYICRASLSNRVPANMPITCGVEETAYEELGMPSPGILDPRATGKSNLFYIPFPLNNIKEILRCYKLWVFSTLDWIVVAKYKSYTTNGRTRWVWPDAPHLTLPNTQHEESTSSALIPHPILHSDAPNSMIIHPQFNSRINKTIGIRSNPAKTTYKKAFKLAKLQKRREARRNRKKAAEPTPGCITWEELVNYGSDINMD
jgi:hypothetical protein